MASYPDQSKKARRAKRNAKESQLPRDEQNSIKPGPISANRSHRARAEALAEDRRARQSEHAWMLGRLVWLGAGGLGVLTAIAMLTANDFWHLIGHDRFITLNAFFEHLGLIAGLVIVSIHAAVGERA